MQAIRCGTFLRRDCKRTKESKDHGPLAAFASFCRRGQKDVAPGARNIPAVGMKEKRCRAVEDAGPYGVRERGHGRANRGTEAPAPTRCVPSGCAGEWGRGREKIISLMWTEKGSRRGSRRGRGGGEVYMCAETKSRSAAYGRNVSCCGGISGGGDCYYRVAGEERVPEVPGGFRRPDPGGVRGERRRGEIGRKKGIPWEEMRERYEARGISFRALGKLYGVTERAVSRHAQDEDWYGQRRWSRTKRMETQTCLANVARQLNRAAASAAERMDMGEADVREIQGAGGTFAGAGGAGEVAGAPEAAGEKERRHGAGGAVRRGGGAEPMRAEVMTLGTPNPRQREFLACEKKYVAFGGARGGGKSWAVRCKAKLLALRYAGIRILLVRRSLAELEANHLAFLRQELADVAEYRAGERQFRFCNGSVLQFGYCGLRPRSGPVPGRGVRRHLSGRGHAAEGAVDAADCRLRPRGQRLPQAHLLYVQSGRAGARVHQAAVHRQAVRGRRASRRTTPLFRRGSRTTRRCWRGSRTISRRWRPCPTS